jgi:hypothetical protein
MSDHALMQVTRWLPVSSTRLFKSLTSTCANEVRGKNSRDEEMLMEAIKRDKDGHRRTHARRMTRAQGERAGPCERWAWDLSQFRAW